MKKVKRDCETARELLQTIPLIMRVVASRLRQSGPEIVPAHYRTLKMLSKQDWSLSQLARFQHLSLPTISNTITILEERGWVSRTRSQTDRRVTLVALTSLGKSALQSAHDHAEAYIAGLMAALSEEEEENLRQGLVTLQRLFEAEAQGELLAGSDSHQPE